MADDKRLIEDYLPIEAISAEASREKSVRKGHISTLHLWWARRPLVACRAAVYGALVPASRFVPNGASDDKKKSLGRANAAKFIERLCKYPGDKKVIAEAQRHILEAHAERLTDETGETVTVEDIEAGRAPRPKVVDMFAGGGAIPLEALRLGCEAYALDLNPVAHIIQLCTLVYPQKYGHADPTARGMTGPPNEQGKTTWGGLANEVRYWGKWVLERAKAEIGDLYPPIPDPDAHPELLSAKRHLPGMEPKGELKVPGGYLTPVAYLWTRTVTCKHPDCKASVPLVKQAWLCKKKDRYVALKRTAPNGQNQVRFEIVESRTEKGLGLDPEVGSTGGNAICDFCGTVADSDYVMAEGHANRVVPQLMAVVCLPREGTQGKLYLPAESVLSIIPDAASVQSRLDTVCSERNVSPPSEPINPTRPSPNARGVSAVTRHGLVEFRHLFSERQQLCLLHFAVTIRDAHPQIEAACGGEDRAKAITTYLGAMLDRLADFNSSLCCFNYTGGRGVKNTFARHALPMVWDYAETNPFNPEGASWVSAVADLPLGIPDGDFSGPAHVYRGSATANPLPDSSVDAVISDPPYYDNIPYADVSDFFYVWLRRSVGHLYPEHFTTDLTPKKAEATALSSRHGGNMTKAKAAYEQMMAISLAEAQRVLKPGGSIAIVYAHKTTLGWATLVNALRDAGFMVTESWPLDTEKVGRAVAQNASALASSIFLVGRKREGTATGSYETDVQPELEAIVRERVNTLWDQGISGADLVIACVGAGLRAFTRFARVEYANGDEVPAERFLTEVETVVLDSILGRLSKEVGGNGSKTSLAGVDPMTRFYTLWRYTYRLADLDAGEAIIFANGTHVELDGATGVSSGARALVEKKKGKYRLRDFTERGDDEDLGLPSPEGQPPPLIDVLHRTLWLMEHRPRELAEFLRASEPNREQMRLVAQALAGPALKGGEMADVSPTGELAALSKLTANWRSVIEDNVVTAGEQADRKRGQRRIFE